MINGEIFHIFSFLFIFANSTRFEIFHFILLHLVHRIYEESESIRYNTIEKLLNLFLIKMHFWFWIENK